MHVRLSSRFQTHRVTSSRCLTEAARHRAVTAHHGHQARSPGNTTMYAVIETGGKQYRVAEGDKVRVEKLDAETGASIDIDKVLMIADGGQIRLGKPFIEGTKVTAEITSHGRNDKVKIIKFRRRKHHLKRQGHRQWFTELKITGISAG
jgi:large subunit ribosomal protein L21